MSFGLLVGRFGQFVREQNDIPVQTPAPEPSFPLSQEARALIAHHLIPLALLAQSDGDASMIEQKAIFDHVAAVLAKAGHRTNDTELAALKDYVANFRPSLMQLDPAIHRLEKESPDVMISLLGTARAVVLADGRIDPAEARLLDELKLEFAKV